MEPQGDQSVGGAPPAALWASDERGFGQVGCVYTAQGFEYEWNGVLLGPDLVWRTDRWVAVRVTIQLAAGIQTFPLVSSVRTSKGRRPCLTAVDR